MLLPVWGTAQDMAFNDPYDKAHDLAFEGKHGSSREVLANILLKNPMNTKARLLLARIDSWDAKYEEARNGFNLIISTERMNSDAWISAIKNELYAKNPHTALGLANKALHYLKNNLEVERLQKQATQAVSDKKYPKYINTPGIDFKSRGKKKTAKTKTVEDTAAVSKGEGSIKSVKEKEILNNRLGVNNSFTVFNDVYEPMIFSSISFNRRTPVGTVIPRINYSNRLNKHGVQYDIDLYPKFSKRFYAYLNYGYSNSSIYPNHKIGGDLYANLPWAMEVSAGMRHIIFDTRNITVYANSIGHYRGNYYFSLRSYFTPKPDGLLTVSGNLLVRKYLKDGENYIGVNAGLGFSPELRQIRDGATLLAETLLYIESQRLQMEYQFTPKKNPNIYRANVGVTRQEFVSNSGSFFWAVSAGFSYQAKF
ncbi:YaiO family outer membrane beta-barrel protein [Costertonia aggregata]|uniref:YaiO family outer membrane beta-barrel protein n=2 Tax=Costertonia aggregata TaxID=343403 RepID=A0A7H9AVI7_9FLAO|nr:YaiO family outer membrane beta-barrel protein [Costertonia aggregata]